MSNNYKILYNRLLIFDGSHALHRAITEPHLWEMKNEKDQRTGGVYGTLQTILKESSTYNYYPVVVFDGGLSKRRLELHPNYKNIQNKHSYLLENKQLEGLDGLRTTISQVELQAEQEWAYKEQRKILQQLLSKFGIPVISIPNWEGDDIIYILTQLSKDSIIVSDDKDLIQLITETPNRRCRIKRGINKEFLDINYFKEKEITSQEYVMQKAVLGDVSDNIPSACFNVGEKTVKDLYELYKYCCINNINFPKTEEQLTELCKTLNISKRKAYLNFNVDQFIVNLLLTDLEQVDVDLEEYGSIENNENPILDTINYIVQSTSQQPISLSNIIKILESQNIKTFNTQKLIETIENRKNLIFIDNLQETLNVPEINGCTTNKLF